MSFIKLPKKEETTAEVRQMLQDAENRWGYMPNIVRAYALAPEVMKAEDVWSKGVMYKGFLPRRLKEAIATTVSRTNDCNYCASSHAHAYTLAGGESKDARACKLLDFEGFDERESVALRFTNKAASKPKSITQEDMNELRKYYTDGEIVEIATVIQQFMGYNWFVTILGLELESANKFKD